MKNDSRNYDRTGPWNEGFKPKSTERWNPDDWAKGCISTTELSCEDKDKIGVQCLNNCSCMAYSNTDIRDGGSGCAIWYGDLIDIRQVAANGQDLYIQMPASKKGRRERLAKDEGDSCSCHCHCRSFWGALDCLQHLQKKKLQR
uniref:Apple domain-containing protein n=1 Tax=Quercus lobata TaxID=97700 RepID=A0A7N2MAD8_QUELO